MTKHNFLHLLGKKAGQTTIFLRNTQNYITGYLLSMHDESIERAMTIFGHCRNVLNNKRLVGLASP